MIVAPNRRVFLMVLGGCIAYIGCSETNTLEGSLTEILDLDFTDVKAAVSDSEASIRYLRYRGEQGADNSEDVVFKLSALGSVTSGSELDLSPSPDGTINASVTRSVAEDPVHLLAGVKRGTLKIDSLTTTHISGSFRVTLGEGGDAGRGRTAFGKFSAAIDGAQ